MTPLSEALAVAVQHHQAGRMQAAEKIYRQILSVDSTNAEAWHLLGVIALQCGQHDVAVEYISRAIQLNGSDSVFHLNLGNCFMGQGKPDEAITCFRRALDWMPNSATARYNLATAFSAQGKLEEAVAHFVQALELKPDHAEAYNNLGAVLQSQRKLDEAIAFYRRALVLNPDNSEARANFLLSLPYHAGTTLLQLAAAHADVETRHAAPLRATWESHANDCNPERIIRLGFVSADFGHHPVGYFLIRALENLDPSRCEFVCYADRNSKDDLTRRFEAACPTWREDQALTNQALAAQIRADRIDILFDLAGHTATQRLLVFAHKPAPIQVTWAGYVGTTGLKVIDYILADRYEIPPEAEPHYCERVLRMPDGYVTYDPPDYAPPVSPLPASMQPCFTFGSFNKPAKITPPIVKAWANILTRVPRSRLVLKFRGMEESSVVGPLSQEFADQGVDPSRIECLGWSPPPQLLAEYGRIDLALDTYPYNGGLTTCEALWMGVPVVTCPGETFASRHSLSHLSNVGLTETIARDLDEYARVAVSLAGDLPRLAAIRNGLRGRLGASPLCDGKRFANHLMALVRDIWRRHCAK